MLHLPLGIPLVLYNRALLRVGLRRPVNGWRRGAGLVLRGEAAKFVLSAFSLDIFSDDPASPESAEQHLTERLEKFLASESEFFAIVRRDPDIDAVCPHPSPAYTLRFDPPIDGPARFIRPDIWSPDQEASTNHTTAPLFEFVCRITPQRSADLWVRINHVAVDGVPAQQMLTRLEAAWGTQTPIVVPSANEFEPHTIWRSSPGRPNTVEVQTFLEFDGLLDWRKRQNTRLPEQMTVGAALMWWLAKHETFSRLYLGTTVELPNTNGTGGGVGVVVMRPPDYFHRPRGLALYVQTFNRDLQRTRQRKSEGCKTLDAAAFLPPQLERRLLHHALDQGTRAFGSVGLTILKDAKVFGAPLGDAGHVNGFIAIGSVTLKTTDGKRVGCVVVKGPQEKIANYAKVLREVVQQTVKDGPH